jgi:hypothetical protein
MANFLYAKALQFYYFPDIVSNTIQLSLIRTSGGYTPNQANDEFYSVIPPAAIAAVAPNPLSGKTFVGGVFDADDISFQIVPAGPACDGLLIWHDMGNPATSRLIAWIDSYSGFPVTPDGVNWVNVQWPTSGIFKI